MKKILSEKNIAGGLFILVMVIFSLAHEDSKKRNGHYNTSVPSVTAGKTSYLILFDAKAPGKLSEQKNVAGVK